MGKTFENWEMQPGRLEARILAGEYPISKPGGIRIEKKTSLRKTTSG